MIFPAREDGTLSYNVDNNDNNLAAEDISDREPQVNYEEVAQVITEQVQEITSGAMVGFDQEKLRLKAWEYSLAGAFAGALTRFLAQPFDVLKTRFQLQVEPISKHSESSKYANIHQAFGKIFREEGIAGLWKGHFSGQLLSVTYGVVQFQAFEFLTKSSEDYLNITHRSPTVHAICGSFAGVIATVCSFPFDILRTRFIAQGNDKVYLSLLHGFTSILKQEGPLALFKGLTPAIILVAPQAGAIFASHNVFTSLYQKINGGKELDLTGNLIVGSLAGTFGKTFVYPLDLSRKRLQLQGFQGRKGFGENFTCWGLWSCFALTYKREGFYGLFKGLSPSIVKAAVTTALHFTTYEETCKFLARRKRFS